MAFILVPGSDCEMSVEDIDEKSNKEAPQEAENDFEDVEFDFNISDDDDIQEIISHRESCNKDGEPVVAKVSTWLCGQLNYVQWKRSSKSCKTIWYETKTT